MTDMKGALLEDISIVLIGAGIDGQNYSNLKADIQIVLDKYEIMERHTEIAVCSRDRNWELLQKFIIAKTVAGCTTRTLNQYKTVLNRVLGEINKTVDYITADDIRLYMALRLRRDKISKVTLQNEWRDLSSFFSWLTVEDIISTNPMIKVESVKAKPKHEDPFSELEIEKIRNCLKDDRERAIIEILLSTGCRISELVQMKVSELDNDKIIVHGKGEKDRLVYLNAKAIMSLNAYLQNRKSDDPMIFPITYGTAEKIVRNIGERASVKNVHPHRFRKTCATMALRRGMPLEQVSKMLGHEQLDTTKIYISIADDEVERAHKKYVI